MIKKAALTLSGLALALGGAALIAPAAQADSSASISGARATFTSEGDIFRLYDTKCDDNPVYLRYKVDGGSENRMKFSGGCNKSAKYDKNFSEGSRIEYKACVDIRPGVDKCSGWTTDTA
jgi:hypothetical protein